MPNPNSNIPTEDYFPYGIENCTFTYSDGNTVWSEGVDTSGNSFPIYTTSDSTWINACDIYREPTLVDKYKRNIKISGLVKFCQQHYKGG